MASNSASIQIKGLGGLVNKVKLLVPSTRAAVKEAVAEMALLVESDAKQFSPVDTGLNRAEIHSEIAPNGLSAKVAAGTNYAVFLENGTRYQRARPFLGPAFDKNKGAFLAAMKKAGITVR